MLNQLDNEPIFRAIARDIEERIVNGDLRPGDLLPAELAIAGQLKVNRSSVREAIRLLERNGLVAREPGKRKLRVTIPNAVDLSKVVSTAMILRKVTFQDLWEMMHALEPMAAAAAASRRDEITLKKLEDNLVRTEQALGNSEALTLLDTEFHDLITEATGNCALELSRQPLSRIFHLAYFNVISRISVGGQRLLHAHKMVYAAVRDGDPETARIWMEKHIRDFKRGYELVNLDMNQPIDVSS